MASYRQAAKALEKLLADLSTDVENAIMTGRKAEIGYYTVSYMLDTLSGRKNARIPLECVRTRMCYWLKVPWQQTEEYVNNILSRLRYPVDIQGNTAYII
ncbi:MAG: hypothetical protein ABIC04_05935 [Nanoarchaeota archaeon]